MRVHARMLAGAGVGGIGSSSSPIGLGGNVPQLSGILQTCSLGNSQQISVPDKWHVDNWEGGSHSVFHFKANVVVYLSVFASVCLC